jgi:hypothetical protein
MGSQEVMVVLVEAVQVRLVVQGTLQALLLLKAQMVEQALMAPQITVLGAVAARLPLA